MASSGPVLLLFLDGVGIGTDDPDRNPFLRSELPVLSRLAGGSLPTLANPTPAGGEGLFLALDANLGVDGTPRSGTGQVALLTGGNAPRQLGRHFGPWVPVALRPLLEEANVLSVAARAGRSVAFANAYPVRFLDAPSRRWAAPPTAARAAGVLVRHEEALLAGTAVASELDHHAWRTRLGVVGLPDITAREAGIRLGRIAAGHELTLFAHYATDTAGHRGGMPGAVEALERVDAFLGGVLEALPSDHLLVVASDHGNIEDVATGHTRNPALGLLVGPGASGGGGGRGPTRITDVPGLILHRLGVPAPPLHEDGDRSGRASTHGNP